MIIVRGKDRRSKMANKKENLVNEEVLETALPEELEVAEEQTKELAPHEEAKIEEKKVVKKAKPLPTKGIVKNCNALRIREGGSLKSKEIGQIPEGGEVVIDHENSTESFYAVTYNNIIGFSLKTFIELGK